MKEPFSNMKTVNSTTTGNTNQFEASSLNSPKHSGSTETVPYDTLWPQFCYVFTLFKYLS